MRIRGRIGQAIAASCLTLCLSACLGSAGPARIGPADRIITHAGDECGAAALTGLQGERIASLADTPLPGELRVLRPGQEVRNDLSVTRLNVQLDGNGRILRLFCG